MGKILIFLAGSAKRSFNSKTIFLRSQGTRGFCSTVNEKKDFYEVLGIEPLATHAEIKQAYYDLSKKFHPDRNEGVEAATKFRLVTEAYEVLGNYSLRKRYDKGMPLYPLAEPSVRKKPVVAPDVQYQKFFDSRMHKLGTTASSVGGGSNWFADKKRDPRPHGDPWDDSPLGVRFAIGVFLASVGIHVKLRK